jgi:hypothetical protein
MHAFLDRIPLAEEHLVATSFGVEVGCDNPLVKYFAPW